MTKESEKIIADFYKNQKLDRLERIRHLNKNIKKGQILFTGSSLMEQFPINEILSTHGYNITVYNRGIGGYTIPEMLKAMDEQIFDLCPSKIFINIGTNDLSIPEETSEKLKEDYKKVLDQIKERLPETKVYMMAYYPVNIKVASSVAWEGAKKSVELRMKRLDKANKIVEELAKEYGYNYINVNAGLTNVDLINVGEQVTGEQDTGEQDTRGQNTREQDTNCQVKIEQTKSEYSIDGIHMWADAYEIIFNNMKKYIFE